MIAARFFVNRRAEQDFYAIQNAHDGIVSRLGGLAVFLTFILFLWALNLKFLKSIFLTNFYIGPIYFLMVSLSQFFSLDLLKIWAF